MNVSSCIALSANAPKVRPERLPAPEHVAAVGSIPKEITGFERRYLEALQQNVAARKEYRRLLDGNSAQQPNLAQVDLHGTGLSDHVELLKLRTRRQQLCILQQYLARLQQTDTAKPEFLDLTKIPRCGSKDHLSERQYSSRNVLQPDESVDALVRQLEVVVIHTQDRVDHERRLLEEVQKKAAASLLLPKQKCRSQALAATRDELVSWMEEKLSGSSSGHNSAEDDLQHGRQTHSPIPHLQRQVMDKYGKYTEARQKMLHLVSMITTATSRIPAEGQVRDCQACPRPKPYQPMIQSLLPFVATQINYPARLHQLQRQQASYLAIITKKGHGKTIAELSRLADESHLLPTYPMMAQQGRFKHAAAATAAKFPCGEAVASYGEHEMARKVEAWAFAADAAKEATRDLVSSKLDSGGEATKASERWLARLRELLGEDGDVGQNRWGGAHVDGDSADEKEAEGDVWALEAAAGPFAGGKRVGAEMKSPWTGLFGNVGLRQPR